MSCKKPKGIEKEIMEWANDPFSSANWPPDVPRPPKEGIEHDFRMTPTRISAKKYGASWLLYEKNPQTGIERILSLRGDWADVFTHGKLLTRALDGRTLEQGVADGIIAGPLT